MFDNIGSINRRRRRRLASRFCLRDLGMEWFVYSMKVHLHKYLTRDSTHIEVFSFNSLRDSGSKGEIVVWETQKKNHGA